MRVANTLTSGSQGVPGYGKDCGSEHASGHPLSTVPALRGKERWCLDL